MVAVAVIKTTPHKSTTVVAVVATKLPTPYSCSTNLQCNPRQGLSGDMPDSCARRRRQGDAGHSRLPRQAALQHRDILLHGGRRVHRSLAPKSTLYFNCVTNPQFNARQEVSGFMPGPCVLKSTIMMVAVVVIKMTKAMPYNCSSNLQPYVNTYYNCVTNAQFNER